MSVCDDDRLHARRIDASGHRASGRAEGELEESYREFVTAFQQASADLRSGVIGVPFPKGSFPPGLPFVRGGLALVMP